MPFRFDEILEEFVGVAERYSAPTGWFPDTVVVWDRKYTYDRVKSAASHKRWKEKAKKDPVKWARRLLASRNWYKKQKADPEKREAYRAKDRVWRRNRDAKRKAEGGEAYAAHLAKNRERMRANRAKHNVKNREYYARMKVENPAWYEAQLARKRERARLHREAKRRKLISNNGETHAHPTSPQP